jgi:adenosine deaminase
MPPKTQTARAELHTHLGSAVDPAILWSIAHRQGIKLPSKNYWDFEKMITMSPGQKNRDLNQMHFNFFHWTELIQSSPEAIEEAVKSVIGGGYRKCNLILQELRFNPMFRNRKGERDLDQIIMAALWGIEQAMFEYSQVKAGIILMADRMLTFSQNEIIIEKAIKYRKRGVIGIDIAGPERKAFSMQKYLPLLEKARTAGLGITVHTGEAGSLAEMRFVVKQVKPDRIGHGIKCVQDKALMKEISAQGIVLEICPSSNIHNSVVKNMGELKKIIRTLLKNNIKLTINTDGPEMYRTNIFEEQEFLRKNGILSQKEIDECTKWAFEASFIKN